MKDNVLKEGKPPAMISRTKAAHEIAAALHIPYEAALMLLYGLCATDEVRWVDSRGEIIDADAVTVADFSDKPVYIAVDYAITLSTGPLIRNRRCGHGRFQN
jgi:hypothetical protein